MDWYYARGEEQVGPVSESDFQKLVEQGAIGPETMVSRSDMSEWQPYSKVTESAVEERYALREMGIGDILDQAVKLLKNHFKLLFLISCFLSVPAGLIHSFAVYAMMPTITPGAMTDAQAVTASMRPVWIVNIVFALLQVVVIMPLTNGATIAAISSEYLNRKTTPVESIKLALSRFWPLIWTGFLATLFISLGLLALIIPGIFLIFRYWLKSQVVIIEGESGSAALKRSAALMKGNMGKAFVLGLLLVVINMLVESIAQFIPVVPLSMVVQIFLTTVVFIFGAAATVAFYFSTRCQHENFDLEVLATAMEKEKAL